MATTENTTPPITPREGFIRTPQLLFLLGVGKTTLWEGIKDGRFPKPTKLGPRINVWRAAEIYSFLENLGKEE